LDVTAEVDAVQALTESEEQYRDLFNSIDIGFCVLEMIGEPGAWADYRFVSVNPVFERHTGLTNAVGHTARELVPGLEDIWVDMYGRVAESGELFRFTEESPAMGRWFDVSAVRVGGPHGWRVALLFNDITHQKTAEQTIRVSERQLRAMADAMPQVVWVADANGQVTYYNSRVRGFLGVRENPDGTWEWEPVLHADDLERTAADWSKAVADRTPYQCEHRVSMADGTYRWHLSRGVPVDSTGMGVMQWFGTATDIHDLKLAQEALQQADRRKDEFLATLAHELRNPLAPIRNGLYVLRMQANDPTGREKTVAMMERQLGHMVVLIDDLLDVSRITRGKLTLRREPVDLSVAIDMAIEAAQPLIQQNAHTLDVRVVTGPLTVHGDVNRLAQVVGNLLTNSAKYTPRGGHITLLAEREADTAVISVLDTGIGIPQASLERVFDLFSQIDRTLEKTTGGLGIGLALVRGLVEMHGGSVTAFSDGEGKGSKFTVRLPLLGTTRLAPVASNGVMANGTANRQRVLVADDNVDAADSLAAMLQLAGHEVRVARDGVEAVTVAEQFHPQLILMDVGMPRLNGLEATRRIRSQPWGRKVRIVALTGWGQEADREKTAAAGCDRHFVKPVSLADVTDLLTGSATTSHESRSTEAR
jgi:PAS domain S-box-containing protein